MAHVGEGNAAEARVYWHFAHLLRHELGLSPSSDLRRLLTTEHGLLPIEQGGKARRRAPLPLKA